MNSKQVILITGASTGFGRLFTDTLARSGHTVFAKRAIASWPLPAGVVEDA